MGHLRGNAEIYSALKNPDDEFWISAKNGKYNDPKLKQSLKSLKVFHITSPHSALLAGFHKLSPKDFVKYLYHIESLSLRYHVIGEWSLDPQKKVYDKLTADLNAGKKLKQLRPIFMEIYPADDDFIRDFMNNNFSDWTDKRFRYILWRIEKSLNPEAGGDESHLSLEHILPKNPKAPSQWLKVFPDKEDRERQSKRIGNMTLLSEKGNRKLGDLSFDKKHRRYSKAGNLKITRKICEYPEWNTTAVQERQGWLAQQAVQIWRIS